MVVLISEDRPRVTRVLLWIVILIAVMIIIWALWKYVYLPYRAGTLKLTNNVKCTVRPAAPTQFTVKLQSNNRAYASWTAAANTDSYIIYVGNTASFAIADAERNIITTSTNIMILNLVPKTYYFKVVAVNTCGTSEQSPEVSIVVTQWPAVFKLCKRDNPSICVAFEGDGEYVRMTNACLNNQCQLTYAELQKFKSFGANLCLTSVNLPGNDIETPVTSELCENAGNWNIDLSTGRVSNAAGLCFGGASTQNTAAYNTTCSQISNPEDARYAWDIFPLTN